jgi:hypothetical protein
MITYTFESTEYGKDGTANCSTSPRGACKCSPRRVDHAPSPHTGTANWYRSIVLGGASTMFAGLAPRLASELHRSAPDGCVPEVLAVPARAHGAWLGGSILGSLSVMSTMWISKADYDENGPLIVHRKVRRHIPRTFPSPIPSHLSRVVPYASPHPPSRLLLGVLTRTPLSRKC